MRAPRRRPVASCLVAACLATPAAALLGGGPTAFDPTQQVLDLLKPQCSFSLDHDDDAGSDGSWQPLARKAAGLEQLECSPTLLQSTESMVSAASEGDALAMAALGTMYLFGQDCLRKRNLTWGVHWLGEAARQGQPDAMATMGFLHSTDVLRDLYNFTGLEANRTRARELFEAAAAGGSQYGALALGYRHATGVGYLESCERGSVFYELAATRAIADLDVLRRGAVEQSNPTDLEHMALLANTMPDRDGMDAAAVEYMDECANFGDVTGQVSMGHLFHAGNHGVPRDKGSAMHWFKAAARKGDGMGHANYGMMQLRAKKYRGALRSLRRATQLRDVSAWAGVGYAYLYGAGVPQDDGLAAKSIWLAAKQGHLDSIYNMGVLALLGRGVPQSVRDGFRYLSTAAEYGHPQAQLHVGRLARRGLGVRKDCHTAQFFLKHAAENGPLVRSLMGTAFAAYEAGRPQRAILHYLLAANAGVQQAQHNAGFLYANAKLPLRSSPPHKLLYAQRALQLLKGAAIQGSKDAQVQLGNLLVSRGEHGTANTLYKEAAQAGSTDALFHLGMQYARGHGVEKDWKTAWQLLQSAGFASKFATLKGAERAALSTVRFFHDFRVPLLLGAALLSVLARGGDPMEMVRGAMGGGMGGGAAGPAEAWEDDGEFDDFDDFDDDVDEA